MTAAASSIELPRSFACSIAPRLENVNGYSSARDTNDDDGSATVKNNGVDTRAHPVSYYASEPSFSDSRRLRRSALAFPFLPLLRMLFATLVSRDHTLSLF
jgi:hypothetical protein